MRLGLVALLIALGVACDRQGGDDKTDDTGSATADASRASLGATCDGACADGLSCQSGGDWGAAGYCTTTCTSNAACGATGVCVNTGVGSWCLETCADGSCLGDATCTPVEGVGVCVPEPEVDPGPRPTITDTSSPYYDHPCDFSWHADNPSTLIADCRCTLNELNAATRDVCLPPGQSQGDFGEGPRFLELEGYVEMGAGYLDAAAHEIFVPVFWNSGADGSIGALVAVNWDTGDRRLVSGQMKDPRQGTVSRGVTTAAPGIEFDVDGALSTELDEVYKVMKGPDGKLYVWGKYEPGGGRDTRRGNALYRVDPVDGDREVIWYWHGPTENDANVGSGAFAMCENGKPAAGGNRYCQPDPNAFTMDPDGNFYLSCIQYAQPGEGVSVVKLASDLSTCTYVSRVGTASDNRLWTPATQGRIGGGYDFTQSNYYALHWGEHDDQLYAYHFITDVWVRIDPATGDRLVVAAPDTTYGEGAPVVGQRWMTWDPTHSWMWTAGAMGGVPNYVPLDLDTGDRRILLGCDAIASTESPLMGVDPALSWRSCVRGPAAKPGVGWNGFWLLPGDAYAMVGNGVGLMKIDLATGNSVTFSQ